MANMYIGIRRDRMKPGERKVSVFRFIITASSETDAMRILVEENSHTEGATYRVRPLDDDCQIIGWDNYMDDATDEDRARRAKYQKERAQMLAKREKEHLARVAAGRGK